jgi:hypothetical protein
LNDTLDLNLDIENLGIDAPVESEKVKVLIKAKEFLRGKFTIEEKKVTRDNVRNIKLTVSFYCLIN